MCGEEVSWIRCRAYGYPDFKLEMLTKPLALTLATEKLDVRHVPLGSSKSTSFVRPDGRCMTRAVLRHQKTTRWRSDFGGKPDETTPP